MKIHLFVVRRVETFNQSFPNSWKCLWRRRREAWGGISVKICHLNAPSSQTSAPVSKKSGWRSRLERHRPPTSNSQSWREICHLQNILKQSGIKKWGGRHVNTSTWPNDWLLYWIKMTNLSCRRIITGHCVFETKRGWAMQRRNMGTERRRKHQGSDFQWYLH